MLLDFEKGAKGRDRKFQDLLHAFGAKLERQMREAFMAAVETAGRKLDQSALIHAIQNGDVDGAFTAVGLDGYTLTPLNDVLHDAVIVGGVTQAQNLGEDFKVQIKFDRLNPRVVDYVRRVRFDLVREISNRQKAAIRAALLSGISAGDNPSAIARVIRASIGLTERDVMAVESFRSAIENSSLTDAVRPGLGPKLETMVRRVVRENQSDRIDELVDRYRQRLLKRRSETIARTEAMRALNAGAHEALTQAVEDRAIDPSRLRRYWLTARDEITCPVCNGISMSNKAGVPANVPFVTSKGSLLAPPAHPNCRCTVFYRLETGHPALEALNPAPKLVNGRYRTLAESYKRPFRLPRRKRARAS